MAGKVTDPALLAELDAPGKVTDPGILAELEGGSATPAAPRSAPSASRWSQKLGEGMVPGFNRISAALQAAADAVIPGRAAEWGPTFAKRYEEHLRANKGQSAETSAEHPWISAGVQTAGAIPAAMALGPTALPQAMGLGAAYGAGDTRGRNAEEVIGDAALGAAGGATATAIPHALLAGENAVRSGVRAVLPKITPTPAAQNLLREGVPLTAGQMNPDSTYGHIEEASSHNPLGMQPEREAAKEAARNAALNRAVAPGANAPTTGGVQDRLRAIYEGFGPAYDSIRDTPVPAEVLKGMPGAAMGAPGNIDARTRIAMQNEIGNAMTVLPGVEWHPPGMHGGPGKLHVSGYDSASMPVALMRPLRGGEAFAGGEFPAPPERGPAASISRKELLARSAERAARRDPVGPPDQRLIPGTTRPNPNFQWSVARSEPPPTPEVTAGDLMKVRENIRAESRVARKTQDFDRLKILGHAEDVVTDALEQALPPEKADLLRRTDRQYARFATMEDAASRGGPESEFSPRQLSASVARSAGRRSFTQGGAGDLQDLAQDMSSVFDQRVPPTGMRGVVLSGMPKSFAGPLARLVNLPEVKSGLMPGGSFALPHGAPVALNARPSVSATALTPEIEALLMALKAKYGGPRGLSPAVAGGEEETPNSPTR